MAIRVDTLDARDFKAELNAWSRERAEHGAACAVDVDGNIKARFLLVFVKKVGYSCDRLVMTGIS